MPAFSDELSESDIAEIASFVSSATGGSTDTSQAATAAQFTPDDTKLSSCQGQFSCLEQGFGNLAYEEGPKVALKEFDKEIAADPEIERNCHRIAHMIGAAALVRFDGRVGKAFAEGSASCWSGYYHGILERAYKDVGSDELGPVSRDLCSDADVRRTAFIAYQCVHGLGHGLMLFTNYDLPRSLSVCDELATSWDQTSCTGGVFMENISSSYGITSKWLRDDDPIYPCKTVAERHKLYCYLMVTSRILPFVNYDFAKAGQMCRKSDKAWITTCFQSLGRDASGQTPREREGDPRDLREGRRHGDGVRLRGGARPHEQRRGLASVRRVLCAKAAAPLQDYCFEGIGTILGGLYATVTEREASCVAVSPNPRAPDCVPARRGTTRLARSSRGELLELLPAPALGRLELVEREDVEARDLALGVGEGRGEARGSGRTGRVGARQSRAPDEAAVLPEEANRVPEADARRSPEQLRRADDPGIPT